MVDPLLFQISSLVLFSKKRGLEFKKLFFFQLYIYCHYIISSFFYTETSTDIELNFVFLFQIRNKGRRAKKMYWTGRLRYRGKHEEEEYSPYNEHRLTDKIPSTWRRGKKALCLVIALTTVVSTITIATAGTGISLALEKLEGVMKSDQMELFNKMTGRHISSIKKYLNISVSENGRFDAHYEDWNDYKSMWYSCLDVKGIVADKGGPFFRLQDISLPSQMNLIHLVNIQDITTAQSFHTKGTKSYAKSGGNFTVPTMYTKGDRSQKQFFPCTCALLLDKGQNSLDIKLLQTFESGLIQMFNPVINNLGTGQGYSQDGFAQGKISIPMIQTFVEPFWMDLPRFLNVSFQLYSHENGGSLLDNNIVFFEPINVINMLNCYSFLRVEWCGNWNWGGEESVWERVQEVV